MIKHFVLYDGESYLHAFDGELRVYTTDKDKAMKFHTKEHAAEYQFGRESIVGVFEFSPAGFEEHKE